MTGDAADLLLACARARTEAGPAARPADVPDWAALLDAADFHNLLPLLYWSIGRGPADLADSTISNPITNPISNPITRLPTHQLTRFASPASLLHQAYVASAKRALFLTVNLAELMLRFDEERIPVIALKGPPLAEWLYPDPALRPSFDLDLLIRPADVPAALALLAREGYRREPYLERLPLKALLAFNCEVLVRREGRAPIELHWAVAPDDFPFRFDAGILWDQLESAGIQVLGRTGTIELNSSVWKGLSKSAQRKAVCLPPEEKLVIQDNFREPMHIRVPFPMWAMNPKEAAPSDDRAASPTSTIPDEEIATY